jgi:hypothetical protein
MKQLSSVRRSPERQAVGHAMPVRAAVAFLLMLVVAGTACLLVREHQNPDFQAQITTVTQAGPASPSAGWYFHSGRWRADARTLVAALEYLVTPEPA